MSRIRHLLVALALVASPLGLASTPASADPGTEWHETLPDGLHVCDNVPPGTPSGAYICEYGVTVYYWPDQHFEFFLIGTDKAVYHSWQMPNGQYSSWGRFSNTVARSGVFVSGSDGSQPTLGVIGTNNRPFCAKFTTSGGWPTTWTSCFR